MSFLTCNIGVPQGSVPGQFFFLLFLLFINDLPTAVQHSFINLFADDTSMYGATQSRGFITKLHNRYNYLDGFCENKLSVNTRNTCVIKVDSRQS